MSAEPLGPAPATGPVPGLPAPQWLLGLPFHPVDLAQAVALVRSAAARHQRLFISTPNINFAVAAARQPAFRDSVLRSDLSLVDGMPLVWLARRLGLPLTQRVAGSDLFAALRQSGTSPPLKVYLFGGPPGIAQRAAERLNEEAGGVVCVGWASPGFGTVEEMSHPSALADINASGADFLVVALGAQKGQAWLLHNLHRLQPPVVSHLGAVVNFIAGSVRRAPRWMQRSGLEWLWRIKEEPGLVQRYAGDGLALLRLARGELKAQSAGRYAGQGGLRLLAPDGDPVLAKATTFDWSQADHDRLLEALRFAAPQAGPWRLEIDDVQRLGRAPLASVAMARAQAVARGVALAVPDGLADRLAPG